MTSAQSFRTSHRAATAALSARLTLAGARMLLIDAGLLEEDRRALTGAIEASCFPGAVTVVVVTASS